jgi:tetraacyldisaccharide 4'-kinase
MTSALQTYWRELASGRRTGPLDRLLLALLALPSLPYSFIQFIRSALYRKKMLATRKLPRPVISIGNITVGGTGKTPTCASIAAMLLAKGMKVAVLSRGYGGTREGKTAIVSDGRTVLLNAEECGDEPYLLASTIPGLMVIIGSDRYSAGMLAIKQLSPDIFLLDDGFQHLQLHRDLNILLLDYVKPFGNGWTLPAGLLREPVSSAKRADLIIHTRSPAKAKPSKTVEGIPECVSRHELADARPLDGGMAVAFNKLKKNRIIAFAGIAEPELFFESLRKLGLNLVATINFPDHADYNSSQISEIINRMQAENADLLITTEKDGVKLKNLPQGLSSKIMLARLSLTIKDSRLLQEKLRNLLQKQP